MTGHQSSLVIFTKAARLLAEADTLQKCKELKDLALTAQDFAKRKRMGDEAILHCRSYALEAQRKMGQMLIAAKAAGEAAVEGRPKTMRTAHSNPVKLPELGITGHASADAQAMAKVSQEDFDKLKAGRTTKAQLRRETISVSAEILPNPYAYARRVQTQAERELIAVSVEILPNPYGDTVIQAFVTDTPPMTPELMESELKKLCDQIPEDADRGTYVDIFANAMARQLALQHAAAMSDTLCHNAIPSVTVC